MSTTTTSRGWRRRAGEYLITAVEVAIVTAALAYVFSGSAVMLLVWEALAAGYLLGGLVLVWRRALKGVRGVPRSGALDTFSWLLPLVASLVGANAAIRGITFATPEGSTQQESVFLGVTAAIGIILSWHLLHTGFAQVYETVQHRDPDQLGLEFSRTDEPGLNDFLYFAFTVGTSFATSDTAVTTTRMRSIVLIHSVVSFFYNALVIAVAIQILQRLAS